MSAGTVLAVAGCKGGVGKTTTAINLGTAASESGRSVLLIETDLAMANVVDFLTLGFDEETDPSLHDVLAGETPVGDTVYATPEGLQVLPSGSSIEGFVDADLNRLRRVIESVRDEFDLLVFDTPAGVSRETLLPMAIADGVILVATPRVSAIRDVQKTADLVDAVGGRSFGLVLTRAGTGSAPPAERLADFVGVDLLGEVPEDPAIPKSQDAGEAVTTFAPNSSAARAYVNIANRLDVSDLDAPPSVTS